MSAIGVPRCSRVSRISPPPSPDSTASTMKPTGSNLIRRAITPPSTALVNTPERSSERNSSVTTTLLIGRLRFLVRSGRVSCGSSLDPHRGPGGAGPPARRPGRVTLHAAADMRVLAYGDIPSQAATGGGLRIGSSDWSARPLAPFASAAYRPAAMRVPLHEPGAHTAGHADSAV